MGPLIALIVPVGLAVGSGLAFAARWWRGDSPTAKDAKLLVADARKSVGPAAGNKQPDPATKIQAAVDETVKKQSAGPAAGNKQPDPAAKIQAAVDETVKQNKPSSTDGCFDVAWAEKTGDAPADDDAAKARRAQDRDLAVAVLGHCPDATDYEKSVARSVMKRDPYSADAKTIDHQNAEYEQNKVLASAIIGHCPDATKYERAEAFSIMGRPAPVAPEPPKVKEPAPVAPAPAPKPTPKAKPKKPVQHRTWDLSAPVVPLSANESIAKQDWDPQWSREGAKGDLVFHVDSTPAPLAKRYSIDDSAGFVVDWTCADCAGEDDTGDGNAVKAGGKALTTGSKLLNFIPFVGPILADIGEKSGKIVTEEGAREVHDQAKRDAKKDAKKQCGKCEKKRAAAEAALKAAQDAANAADERRRVAEKAMTTTAEQARLAQKEVDDAKATAALADKGASALASEIHTWNAHAHLPWSKLPEPVGSLTTTTDTHKGDR